MRTTRLHHPEKLTCGEFVQLDANTSNHLIRVLRTSVNSPVILFNGDGFDYVCRTCDADAKSTRVVVASKTEVNNESNLSITLIQGLSRNDRMDTTIQKSVELGANKIVPIICQRSNTKLAKDKQLKKLEHWRNIAFSACEQSGRCKIPKVTEIKSIHNFQHELDTDALKIILDPESEISLRHVAFSQQPIEIFVGPEGGLNNEEMRQLQENKFQNIRFGPRILRTETAGPAVISALQILWGDF